MLKQDQNSQNIDHSDNPSERDYQEKINSSLSNKDGGSDDGAQTRGSSNNVGNLSAAETAAEQSSQQPNNFTQPENQFYNKSQSGKLSFKNRMLNKGSNKVIVSSFGAGIVGLLIAAMAFFGLLGNFKLDHLMNLIEGRAFARYQVSMDGRSSKWLQAYLNVRLMEVDDPNLAAKDKDNLLFRSDRVDTNNPFTDWYKTMRTSKFEQDLADKHGIKFTSVAKKEGNIIKMRPAVITISDRPIEFYDDLSGKELSALNNVEIENLNGRLRSFVDETVFDNDKEARIAIKNAVKKETHWWQVIKQRHIRKNIQNMTGVRDWRFFDKTRTKASDKTIDIRNKIIISALPESSKSGKFVQCIFGIIQCRATTDPIDPDNRSNLQTVVGEKSGSNKGEDLEGNVTSADGTNGQGAIDIVDTTNKSDVVSDSLRKVITSQILSKLNAGTGLVSLFDSLARIDENIASGSLIALVSMAKTAQATGLFQTYMTARDQSKTGEITGSEFNEFMGVLSNTTSNEGYDTALTTSESTAIAAANEEFVPATNREQYCSPEHQAAINNPVNSKAANKEYHYLCDAQKIGSTDRASTITNWWNTFLAPIQGILAAYRDSPAGSIVNWVNNTISGVLDPIQKAILKASGKEEDIKEFTTYVAMEAASGLGAGPMMYGTEPSGVFVNVMTEGGGAAAEASTRFQGGVASTVLTMKYTDELVAQYQADTEEYSDNYHRYANLDNPDSVLAKAVFAQIGDVNLSNSGSAVTGIATNVAKMPLALLNPDAKAAQSLNTDTRAVANFGGIKMYDLPQECVDLDVLTMKPHQATNADEEGLLTKDEITWDLVNNNTSFMDRVYANLYEKYPDNYNEVADRIYNCAAADTTIRGGIGYLYGYAKDNGLESGNISIDPIDLSISTYNIRNANISEDDPTNGEESWSKRAPAVEQAIKANYSEIWGFQEVWTEQQIEDLQASLDGLYDHTTNIKEAKEVVTFYDNAKYRRIEGTSEGSFKLEKINKNKYCSWVGLERVLDSQRFYVYNCHFSPGTGAEIEANRLAQAKQVVASVKEVNPGNYPVVLLGDFNLHNRGDDRDDEKFIKYLRANGFYDTYEMVNPAAMENAQCSTYNGFEDTFCDKDATDRGNHLDRIFLKAEQTPITVSKFKVVTSKYNAIWPSDHNPVQTILTMNQKGENSSSAYVNTDGYAWPIDISKATVRNNNEDAGDIWRCNDSPSHCHHNNTAAFDLFDTRTNQAGASSWATDTYTLGKAVYAITGGSMYNSHVYGGVPGCYSFHIKGIDGWDYYYTHIQSPLITSVGQKVNVTAGQKVAEVGTTQCANGTVPHLHIDRGSPKGYPGGETDNRDAGFEDLLVRMHNDLP